MNTRTATLALAVLSAAWFASADLANASQATLKIYFIDVDQGDSTLIVTPEGRSLLVDIGDDGKIGAVKAAIAHAGLTSIDFFVVTHYHGDHYGGIDKLGVAPGAILITDTMYDRNSEAHLRPGRLSTDDYQEYEATVGTMRRYLRPGREIPIGGGVTIECVIVNGRLKGEYGQITYPVDENGYSVGLVLNYRDFDMFVGGDLHIAEEDKLADSGILKDVDVYQANHHGSDTSSGDKLLAALRPEVTIISNGTNRGYKHPSRDTVLRLLALPSIVYQTNKFVDATITEVLNTSDEFIADLDSDGPEGTILLEVLATEYRVTLMDRGISRTFPIQYP